MSRLHGIQISKMKVYCFLYVCTIFLYDDLLYPWIAIAMPCFSISLHSTLCLDPAERQCVPVVAGGISYCFESDVVPVVAALESPPLCDLIW